MTYAKERVAELRAALSEKDQLRKAVDRQVRASRLDRKVKVPTDLYFVETQCAEKHIKIGVASNMKERLSTIQTHCPYPVRLLKLVPNGALREKELHARFRADHVTGEWFKRSDELLELIAGLDGITDLSPPAVVLDFDDMRQTWRDFIDGTGKYAPTKES
jgi:hypothetical protein